MKTTDPVFEKIPFTYPVVYFCNDDFEDAEVTHRTGYLKPINMSTEPYEATVEAEGYSFHILVGSQINGKFLCIPDWRLGCELAGLSDIFWNQESILGNDELFGYENATAIAYALKEMKRLISSVK